MARIIFVQNQVSQLDEPVYSRIHELNPEVCSVIYWNDYGFDRSIVDPEIGVVPDFKQIEYTAYPRYWIDRSKVSEAGILAKIKVLDPNLVVLSDQPQLARLRLAIALRRHGYRVALRSDKNQLSHKPRRGPLLFIERQLTKHMFDVLAPVSKLTAAYYGWPETKPLILFPYSTNEAKFSPELAQRAEVRQKMREQLGIAQDTFVFISAIKFSKRESPWELIKCFEAVAEKAAKVHLIAMGDGPLLSSVKKYCLNGLKNKITFTGFIPFRQLQDYFFASNTLLHLVFGGPWEVSPQDALLAGLGIVTSDNVGSGQVLLDGECRRFLVRFGDRSTISSRMLELVNHGDVPGLFASSARNTREFTVDSTARRWVKAAATWNSNAWNMNVV